MKKKCFFVSLLMVSLVGRAFAEKPQMTQAEADVVVEREMFKFIHHDDWMDAIKYWKERGITDEMFAESYAKIARRTMNAPEGTKEHRMCSWAVGDGLRHHANEQQLTNLIYIVECSTNRMIRKYAIDSYHSRKARTSEYLDFVERILKKENVDSEIGNRLFVGMELDYGALPNEAAKLRERIARIALDQVLTNGKSIVAADLLLKRYYRNYENSLFHRRAVDYILDSKNSPLFKMRDERGRSDMVDQYRKEQRRMSK